MTLYKDHVKMRELAYQDMTDNFIIYKNFGIPLIDPDRIPPPPGNTLEQICIGGLIETFFMTNINKEPVGSD